VFYYINTSRILNPAYSKQDLLNNMGRPDKLSSKIANFTAELQRNGCLEANFSIPNLTNEIHPMLHIDRWMRGHGQEMTPHIYRFMAWPLRLASLLLTEECMLWWWAHVHFGTWANGKRKSGKQFRYLREDPREHTREGRREVRKGLNDMAKVIAFMFTPEEYTYTTQGQCYGVTASEAMDLPWDHLFEDHDFPLIPRGYVQKRKRVPRVALRHEYQAFYGGAFQAFTASQKLRVHFMFAATIVHEVAHAYFMFIGKDSRREEPWEPLFSPLSRTAELGFSWEESILGRICDPLFHTVDNCHALFSSRTYAWRDDNTVTAAEVHRVWEAFRRGSMGPKIRQIPLDPSLDWLPTHEWRGVAYTGNEHLKPGVNFLCIIHAIPMSWIARWFQEGEWKKMRLYAKEKGIGKKTSEVCHEMGPCWGLIYEKRADGRQGMWISSV
jgi:hypothetical protein